LNHLSGTKFYSILDLISGFYQVAMDEKDAAKTAFITPWTLQFNKIPTELCISPATLHGLMDSVLTGLKWTILPIYLDDIIVYGRTFKEMVDRIKVVFLKLRGTGLTLKLSKSQLGE